MYKGEICDVHIHIEHENARQVVIPKLHKAGISRYVLQGTGCYDIDSRGISNLLGLAQKLRDPGRCYAFASIDHPDTGTGSAERLLDEVKMYHAMGFDGVKMIEGKPKCRIRTGVPLDDAVYEPMLRYLEDNDIPLLSHVNDPRFFWDKSKMTPRQIANGWFAGPEYPHFEVVRAEALNTMRRHPGLRTVFAHFFFAAGSTDEADGIFDEFPNVSFDLTPGTHFMEMADDRDNWRDYLIRRADRLLYGTDSCILTTEHYEDECRFVLENDAVIPYQGKQLHCFALPEEALAKIYQGNFDRFCGKTPRPVSKDAIPEFISWSKSLISDSHIFDGLCREMDEVEFE